MKRPGFGLLALTLVACSASSPDDAGAPEVGGIPPRVKSAHQDVMSARFSLAACQGPRERQTLNAMDRRRAELELAIAGRYGAERMTALQADSGRAFQATQIGRCAGTAGVDRLQRSTQALEGSLARAGVTVAPSGPSNGNG